MNISKHLRLLYLMAVIGSLFASIVAAGPTPSGGPTTATGTNTGSTISASLCGIVGSVETVIGILALLLFIAGGTLYAGAHLLPAAGNLRGNLQGWSMGMIVGGVVGLILVILAGPLLSVIAGVGGASSSLIPTTCGII